jgi:hypothetical protein
LEKAVERFGVLHRKKAGSRETVALIKRDTPQSYIDIPSRIRTRMEIIGDDGTRCVVEDIVQKGKNLIAEV